MTSDDIHRMMYARLSQNSGNNSFNLTKKEEKAKQEAIESESDTIDKPEPIKPFTISYDQFHPLCFSPTNDHYDDSMETQINNKFDEFFDLASRNTYAEDFKAYRAEKNTMIKSIAKDRIIYSRGSVHNSDSNNITASNNGYGDRIRLDYAHG